MPLHTARTRRTPIVMGPLITHASWRLGFRVDVTTLLLAPMATVGLGWVKVKMLPFENKRLLHAFFTATSMIGFMAGAGIVVRNSTILVDSSSCAWPEGMKHEESGLIF